jgi:hypothetical protein
MAGVRASIVCAASLLIATCLFAEDKKPDPRGALETAIPEGIRLLEAKEYKPFIEKFALPEHLAKMKERGDFDEVVERFGKQDAPDLLGALKSIKDAKPTLDKEGNEATYELKRPVRDKKVIKFKKVDKLWYLNN